MSLFRLKKPRGDSVCGDGCWGGSGDSCYCSGNSVCGCGDSCSGSGSGGSGCCCGNSVCGWGDNVSCGCGNSGPGSYDIKSNITLSQKQSLGKSERFQPEIFNDVPGPGAYELSPMFADTLVKGTFNVNLARSSEIE
ncbi:Hypothetical predicted protein [Octopus vulgaris]|uniref:Uncharacterized protein n=1 Tax=Octopus vulgaris TaxID=6645 RepID=A0AA36FMG3_OCTVU|nr:Hypothetical predicted protein [Octopus vulgaris]